MTSVEQLRGFYDFDESVLERVTDAAEWQDRHVFPYLADYYGVSGGPETVPSGDSHKAFQVLNIKPRHDYDAEEARVYHLPMSMPIDPSMTMRLFRLFEADPAKQLIVAGNPSAAGQRYGKLRLKDIPTVWGGDLTPAVDPLLSYLAERGIKETEEIGYSYGADAAAASSARAEAHDISVRQGVYMESAAATDRGPGLIGGVRLGIDFMSAGSELENYVEACDSLPLRHAREMSDVGLPRYLLGLARMSNLAIGNSLAHNGFEARVRGALTAQDDMRSTLVWGTSSELTRSSDMARVIGYLRGGFGRERVGFMAIQGMHHAGGDNIDLHAAIVLEALRDKSPQL